MVSRNEDELDGNQMYVVTRNQLVGLIQAGFNAHIGQDVTEIPAFLNCTMIRYPLGGEVKPVRYEGMLEKLSEFESRIFLNPTTWKYIRLDPSLPVGQFYINCDPFGEPDPDEVQKARNAYYPQWIEGIRNGSKEIQADKKGT